jgi:ferredoxin-NADP reductase
MEEYTIANKRYKIYNLRLIEIIKETPDAYSYRFALDGLEYKFEPGQFVILFVDIDKIKSYFEEKYLKKEISDSLFQKILKNLEAEKSKAEREGRPLELGRRYSIASSPTRNDYIEITIERYIERDKQTGEIKYLGLLSNYFIDNAKVGEYYKISEAAGSFIFKEGMCDYLNLLAGGSGIVPFMCYIRYAVDKNLDLNINLLYSNRTKDYIIYKSELDEIASKFSNIKITHVLTREKDLSYAKFYGRIDTPEKLLEWLPKEILTHERASNRICGSADYIKSMIRLLTNPTIGVKPSNIMIESYYA